MPRTCESSSNQTVNQFIRIVSARPLLRGPARRRGITGMPRLRQCPERWGGLPRKTGTDRLRRTDSEARVARCHHLPPLGAKTHQKRQRSKRGKSFSTSLLRDAMSLATASPPPFGVPLTTPATTIEMLSSSLRTSATPWIAAPPPPRELTTSWVAAAACAGGGRQRKGCMGRGGSER